MLQDFMTGRSHFPRFLGAHIIDGVIHLGDNVEAVQNVERLRTFLPDNLQIGFPHIRTDEFNFGGNLRADHLKELLKRFHRPFLADPQQTGEIIDLIDQREVPVPACVLNFIHAHHEDRSDFPVLQAPFDNIFDGLIDLVPRRLKRDRRFLPGKLARPVREKLHVHCRQGVLPGSPGKLFHTYAAAPAIHTAHRILKEHRNVPYRNKFESPGLHRIVARSRFLTSGTDRTAIGPRHDGHDQAQAPCPCLIPLRIFVDKGLELLNTIQNSLQAHPVPNSGFGFCQNPKHRIRSGCAISGPSGFPPLRYFRYNSAGPGRRTGQRWEPTRAPTQGPGPKRGVVHDTPFGSPQKNQRTSGLAQSDKSSRKYSPSLFLAPITPVTRVPLLTYRADLTHRFPRGPLYYYFMDRDFGLIHVKLQTWFPLQIQVYVNGHEWLARKLKENGIRYTKQENAFLWIEDMARAQAFSDRFASLEWPRK